MSLFGSAIRQLRTEQGLTLAELASRLEPPRSTSYISDIETGRRDPGHGLTESLLYELAPPDRLADELRRFAHARRGYKFKSSTPKGSEILHLLKETWTWMEPEDHDRLLELLRDIDADMAKDEE